MWLCALSPVKPRSYSPSSCRGYVPRRGSSTFRRTQRISSKSSTGLASIACRYASTIRTASAARERGPPASPTFAGGTRSCVSAGPPNAARTACSFSINASIAGAYFA